jgi:glycosyltransferase involved in cell wall biosynthesis
VPEFPLLPAVAAEPVSVVLLAHQAAPHIDTLLPAWITALDNLSRPWELFVADAGSTDGTVEKAERFTRNPRVQVLRRDGPPAEGLALKAALERTRHPLIFTARLLPRYQFADLGRMLTEKRATHPETGASCPEIDLVHIVTGYRAGRPVPPFWRGVGTVVRTFQQVVLSTAATPLPGWLGFRTHLAGLLYRIVFGICNRDATCPCRLFRRELLPRLALQSESSFVHVEILAKATFLGRLLSEDIPLGERKRNPGPEPALEYVDPPGMRSRDFRRLFFHADFGPVTVPTPETPPTPAPST